MVNNKRCKNCLASENRLSLDRNTGLCDDCSGVIDDGLGDMKNIDCIGVMYSGGKDSIYLLHYLHQNLPRTKIVPIFINNGFYTDEQIVGFEDTLKTIGYEKNLIIDSSHINLFIEQTAKNVVDTAVSDNLFGYQLIDYEDGELIHEIGEAICVKNDIKVLATGITSIQYNKSILNNQPFDSTSPDTESGVMLILPLSRLKIGEDKILESVMGELGITYDKIHPLVSNSQLIHLITYIDYKKYGFSGYEPEICQQIRDSDDDTIKNLWSATFSGTEDLINNNKFDISFPLKVLGISKDELDDLIESR